MPAVVARPGELVEEEGRTGFDRRLRQARDRAGLDVAPKPPLAHEPHPLAVAVRIGAEMVATLVVALAIGYGLDRLFGTRPWLTVLFAPVGLAAGVRNLMRLAPADQTGGADRGRRG